MNLNPEKPSRSTGTQRKGKAKSKASAKAGSASGRRIETEHYNGQTTYKDFVDRASAVTFRSLAKHQRHLSNFLRPSTKEQRVVGNTNHGQTDFNP